MKSISSATLLLLGLSAFADAFPSIAQHVAQAEAQRSRSLLGRLKKRVAFDAKSQLIDVSGAHAYSPPNLAGGDQRGPCPGLNALANHNYLPHNGVGTITQFIEGTSKVFGMGVDLAAFLSIYGAVVTGDGTKWSIGGPTPNVPGLLGLIGSPAGLSGSHNKYESDGSPTRGDLYERGNDFKGQIDQFQALFDEGKAKGNWDIPVLTSFRAKRFQESIARNPNFFHAPFSGILVSPAAYTFIYRFMGNKSAENPEGVLNADVLKSFFGIEGTDGNFKVIPGGERIPENWYTRNALDPYGIVPLALDTNIMGLQHPEFLVPGGNLGKTNTYVGLNPADLTGGVLNAQNLLQGNNAVCLAYQATVQFLPDLLRGLVRDVTGSLARLTGQFDGAQKTLGCPQLTNIDESQFKKFPGFTMSQ